MMWAWDEWWASTDTGSDLRRVLSLSLRRDMTMKPKSEPETISSSLLSHELETGISSQVPPRNRPQGFLTGWNGGNIGNSGGKWERLKIVVFSKMVPLVYFWRINFSHSNTMPFNSRLAVIEINPCQWCHHIAILRYVGLGKGGNNSLVVAKVGKLE